MTARSSLFAFFAACSALLAGPTHAASTGPTTVQASGPTPARRAPVRRPPAALPATPAPAVAASPQPEATPRTIFVAGTVRGTDGQPYPGVCVFPTANPRLIAVTDAMGTFSLQVPAASGVIHLQADYFGVASRRVEVDGQHPLAISIVLDQ